MVPVEVREYGVVHAVLSLEDFGNVLSLNRNFQETFS